MSVYYQSDDVTLHCGDCRDVLPTLAAGSVDAVVTDPPYELGFMSQAWDAAGVAFAPDTWRAVLAVVKPGGYLLAFGGTRTYHRLTCAIEDAGWQIVDSIHWLHAQGFPKGDGQLKPAHEPIVLARKPAARVQPLRIEVCRVGTARRFNEAARNTGSTPASIAPVNVTGYEGALASGRYPPNLLLSHADGCELVGERRVRADGGKNAHTRQGRIYAGGDGLPLHARTNYADADGMETVETWRCVAGCPVAELDRQSGELTSGSYLPSHKRNAPRLGHGGAYGDGIGTAAPREWGGDTGGASRFFPVFHYSPKASRSDRGQGNFHSTVKPTDLMRWLVRLVTPPSVVEYICEYCDKDLPGVRQDVSAQADRADHLLDPVSEHPRGQGRAGENGTSLPSLRDDVPTQGQASEILLDSLPSGSGPQATPDLSDLRQGVPSEDESRRPGTVLLPSVRGGSPTDAPGTSMRDVRDDRPPEEGRREALLLSCLRREMDRPGKAEAADDDCDRIRDAVSAGASDGDQARLCDGTPSHRGEDPRSPAPSRRGGPPHQRQEIGQPSRESGRDGKGGTRPPEEVSAPSDYLPSLRRHYREPGNCPTCGRPLTKRERPGLVLDPFAGSGTTLVAARREGMRAIGVELSADYAAIIADRLQQLALPLGEGEAAG